MDHNFQARQNAKSYGVSDEALKNALNLDLEDELFYSVSLKVPVHLITMIFANAGKPTCKLSKTQAKKSLPTNKPDLWQQVAQAEVVLAPPACSGISVWFQAIGLAIIDIPDFKMLITDNVDSQQAYATAKKVQSTAQALPPFKDQPYTAIVQVLTNQGYVRRENYTDIRSPATTPYGQDVWTSPECMVVRIKVGGRCLAGKFVRPPHAVKEITKVAHQYTPSDVIYKLTDTNILIPAGTKYSAKDMQTWFVQVSGQTLDQNAWKDPVNCGNFLFAELHQLWAEGAHTPIGTVPTV